MAKLILQKTDGTILAESIDISDTKALVLAENVAKYREIVETINPPLTEAEVEAYTPAQKATYLLNDAIRGLVNVSNAWKNWIYQQSVPTADNWE